MHRAGVQGCVHALSSSHCSIRPQGAEVGTPTGSAGPVADVFQLTPQESQVIRVPCMSVGRHGMGSMLHAHPPPPLSFLQAAFIGGYTPHPVEAAAPVALTPKSPSMNDPRVALNRKHQELLAKKEKEEAAGKKAAADRAKAHVAKFNEDRAKVSGAQ